jgi:hypothetical protein
MARCRCPSIHPWSNSQCIRKVGHDGPCWNKSDPAGRTGAMTRATWYSEGGVFKSHRGYETIYARKASKVRE